MRQLLADIKNTQPKREHGSITQLKASIAEFGLICPLTIDDNGNLLAGRRRYQAIQELGWQEVECYILPINSNQVTAMAIAIEENIRRKDLTEVEKAVALAELDELKRKQYGSQPRGNPNLSNFDKLTVTNDPQYIGEIYPPQKGWTQSKTAQDLGISQPKVSRDIKIANAIKEYPELASYIKGAPVLKEYAKRERQKQSVKPMTDSDIKIILGDMRQELEKLEGNSVSLILTDPPYSAEYLPLWRDIARIASRILKPSGFLVAYSGQLYLDKVMQSLGEYLTYYWLAGVWLKGAPSHRFERNIQNAFKPILIYQKPPVIKQVEWLVDLLESPVADKKYHDWGQSEAPIAGLLGAFSNPGDMVIEPFCGGGVVPYVCKKLNRKCVAIEKDEDNYKISLLRLQNAD